MLRHVVMIQFTDETTDADIAAMVDGLAPMPDLIPEIRSYSIGRDAGISEGNFEMVIVGEFDDEAGYHTYASHPDHVAVIVEKIKPFIAQRAAVQYLLS